MPPTTPPASAPSGGPDDTPVQKDGRNKDCLGCRLIGSAAFIGLGAYTFISGQQQLRGQAFKEALTRSGARFGPVARRAGIHGVSACLIGLGVYRLLM
ncbi:hypothetical protein L211DRAFT_802429 [Terfezia boudieri ATCC MYA-4762]|uniref:Distal membrane-arm assembly complex protein 1-like domain-containing protein n=1 Tax=Terfezia boudieri ATCC MYA-4762 TaxID=1051890 RepID=A0A3N4LY66_9PEZI|nr:hypothetical protein L211DRAFT_802429 [Terfezia boudieri ATCC MYA-4762]